MPQEPSLHLREITETSLHLLDKKVSSFNIGALWVNVLHRVSSTPELSSQQQTNHHQANHMTKWGTVWPFLESQCRQRGISITQGIHNTRDIDNTKSVKASKAIKRHTLKYPYSLGALPRSINKINVQKHQKTVHTPPKITLWRRLDGCAWEPLSKNLNT